LFKVGDLIIPNSKNLKIRQPKKKLDHKFWEPFKISHSIKNTAFQLDLPNSWNFHDVYHVSLLERYHASQLVGQKQVKSGNKEIEIEEEDYRDQENIMEEFEVDKILDFTKQDGKVFYIVK
jgi:hypothetical protein